MQVSRKEVDLSVDLYHDSTRLTLDNFLVAFLDKKFVAVVSKTGEMIVTPIERFDWGLCSPEGNIILFSRVLRFLHINKDTGIAESREVESDWLSSVDKLNPMFLVGNTLVMSSKTSVFLFDFDAKTIEVDDNAVPSRYDTRLRINANQKTCSYCGKVILDLSRRQRVFFHGAPSSLIVDECHNDKITRVSYDLKDLIRGIETMRTIGSHSIFEDGVEMFEESNGVHIKYEDFEYVDIRDEYAWFNEFHLVRGYGVCVRRDFNENNRDVVTEIIVYSFDRREIDIRKEREDLRRAYDFLKDSDELILDVLNVLDERLGVEERRIERKRR
jgi:hypothetical protein